MNAKTHKKYLLILITALLLINLSGCSVPDFLHFEATGMSYLPYDAHADSSEELNTAILKAMQQNETTLNINVSSESLINADEWLTTIPGIEKIHCEYTAATSGVNAVITFSYWDNYPIVYAYQTSDTYYLSSQQLELYNKYCEVLSAYTSPNHSQCQNELALHDYLVSNIEYTRIDDSTNYNAYDTMINGTAVCSGYAECFKTFMDMLGIENTVVTGVAGDESHIWNEVCLDGEWYQVDVTWDDPVNSTSTTLDHAYFNITDSDMSSDHFWDNTQVGYKPASGTKYSYVSFAGLINITSQTELNRFITNSIYGQASYIEFISSADIDVKSAIQSSDTTLYYSFKTVPRSRYSFYVVSFTY